MRDPHCGCVHQYRSASQNTVLVRVEFPLVFDAKARAKLIFNYSRYPIASALRTLIFNAQSSEEELRQ